MKTGLALCVCRFEFIVQNLPTEETPGPGVFSGEYQETLPVSLTEASITKLQQSHFREKKKKDQDSLQT